MRLVKKRKIGDLAAEIVRSIDGGCPAVVPVDCFGLSYRRDVYGKKHRPHFICVYGYDKNKGVFHVVDHLYNNDLAYKKRTVDAAELCAAYNAFQSGLNKSAGSGVVVLKKTAAAKDLGRVKRRDTAALAEKSLSELAKGVRAVCRAGKIPKPFKNPAVVRRFRRPRALGEVFRNIPPRRAQPGGSYPGGYRQRLQVYLRHGHPHAGKRFLPAGGHR